jgi:uncharacterized membrane protein
MEFVKINFREQDIAGKYRVWVDVGNNEQIMLKFQTDPSDAEVEEATSDYINSLVPLVPPEE